MKTITLPDNTRLTLYQSIRELPIGLYSTQQKYIMQEAGLGSDYAGMRSHFDKVQTFINQGDTEAASQELLNLQFNMIHMIESISIGHYSFGCLVHSIDKEPVTDYSEPGIKTMLEQLAGSGLTHGLVEDILDELKKNLIRN